MAWKLASSVLPQTPRTSTLPTGEAGAVPVAEAVGPVVTDGEALGPTEAVGDAETLGDAVTLGAPVGDADTDGAAVSLAEAEGGTDAVAVAVGLVVVVAVAVGLVVAEAVGVEVEVSVADVAGVVVGELVEGQPTDVARITNITTAKISLPRGIDFLLILVPPYT